MEYSYIYVFVLSFVSLFIMRKVAKKVGLVDKPNARKHHQGVIPLVGGISEIGRASCRERVFRAV